jgi:hypothetical protein
MRLYLKDINCFIDVLILRLKHQVYKRLIATLIPNYFINSNTDKYDFDLKKIDLKEEIICHFQEKNKFEIELLKKGYFLLFDNSNKILSKHRNQYTFIPQSLHVQNRINFYEKLEIQQDIRMIWEVGRLQLLPKLGIHYLHFKDEFYLEEILSILKDFHEENPIGRGLHWRCAMEAGLRINNIITTILIINTPERLNIKVDLIKEYVLNLLPGYKKFIILNKEKYGKFTGNHYLSNILGLAAINSISKKSYESLSNLYHIRKEIRRQFLKDGGNFEGSTSYHFFSTSLVLHSLGHIHRQSLKKNDLLNNLIKNKIHDTLRQLNKTIKFSLIVVDKWGNYPIIGDNDSSKVIELDKCETENYQRNATLDFFSLAGCFFSIDLSNDNLVNQTKIDFYTSLYSTSFIKKVSCKTSSGNRFSEINLTAKNNRIDFSYCTEKRIPIRKLNVINFYYLDSFGLIILKSNSVYLCINVSKIGQNGIGGHNHDDISSFNLFINNQFIYTDPGLKTYNPLYTRNLFRTNSAHNNIDFNKKGLDLHPFAFERNEKYYLKKLTTNEIIITRKYRQKITERCFKIENENILVTDMSNFKHDDPFKCPAEVIYTPVYGNNLKYVNG